jgi:hypothetical protein
MKLKTNKTLIKNSRMKIKNQNNNDLIGKRIYDKLYLN